MCVLSLVSKCCLSANPSAFGFSPQEAGKLRSPMPLLLPGLHMLSQLPAARATSAIVAVTERNRATTTRRRAGSGEAALRISDTALSSPGGLLMLEKSKRMHGGWWTCTTMRLEERYSRKAEGWGEAGVVAEAFPENLSLSAVIPHHIKLPDGI